MAKEVRYYQNEALLAVNSSLAAGIKNQLLVMATGTGKTKTAVDIIKNRGRVLWCTHTQELITQSAIALLSEMELMPYNELLKIINGHGDIVELLRAESGTGMFADVNHNAITSQIGVIKADLFDINKPVVIASMQTLWRRLDKIPPDHFDVVVVDEAHYAGANTWVKSLNYLDCKLRLGLTATPYRTDGMLMGDIFDKIVYEYPIDKAIGDGYLCEIDAVKVKTNCNLDKVNTVAGELNQGQLEEVINTPERNNLIVEKYLQYCSGRQFLAFCVDVKHAMDLCKAFQEKGVMADFVVGDETLTTDRKGTISKFKKGDLVGITNVMVLTAGFDHPNTGAVLMCCPTKSLTKFLQQVGRATRLKDKGYVTRFGQNCIVLDFIDSTSKHRLVNTWELDKQKHPNDRTFVTKENKLKLIADRERRMQVADLKKDVRVNLLKLPKVKISDSIRMQEPATEKQINWIKSLGYDVVNINYTKAMCSEIISALPAKEWQINKLANAGYDVSQGVTISEYNMAILEIETQQAKENTEKLKKENNFPFNDLR